VGRSAPPKVSRARRGLRKLSRGAVLHAERRQCVGAARRRGVQRKHRAGERAGSRRPPAICPCVIAANLAQTLGDARVYTFSAEADYRVLVDIQRFESVRGAGEAPYNRTP